jgi:hypothetical protein
MWMMHLLTGPFVVHYAGNLQIAASVFIGLGLIFSLALFVVPLVPRWESSVAASDRAEGEERHEHHEKPRETAPITSYVVFMLLSCLYTGALLQILAQYFGVLGLTVTATPNAKDAVQFQLDGANNFMGHDWVIGRALSAFATVAWTSALFCAGIATAVFTRPRFPKLL